MRPSWTAVLVAGRVWMVCECGAQIVREGPQMEKKSRVGLRKEEIRRIVLSKLRIVYRDWRFKNGPFWHKEPKAGQRRNDARAFETALLAALLGGLSEAIEKNNQALLTTLGRKNRLMRMKVQTKRRKR